MKRFKSFYNHNIGYWTIKVLYSLLLVVYANYWQIIRPKESYLEKKNNKIKLCGPAAQGGAF